MYGILAKLRRQRQLVFAEQERVLQRSIFKSLHWGTFESFAKCQLVLLRCIFVRRGKEHLLRSCRLNNSQSSHRSGICSSINQAEYKGIETWGTQLKFSESYLSSMVKLALGLGYSRLTLTKVKTTRPKRIKWFFKSLKCLLNQTSNLQKKKKE